MVPPPPSGAGPSRPQPPRAVAEGYRGHWRTIGDLLPYIWPAGKPRRATRVLQLASIDDATMLFVEGRAEIMDGDSSPEQE